MTRRIGQTIVLKIPFPGRKRIAHIYVIGRLGGPYKEKLWPWSQAEGSIFKPDVTVFHYTDRP